MGFAWPGTGSHTTGVLIDIPRDQFWSWFVALPNSGLFAGAGPFSGARAASPASGPWTSVASMLEQRLTNGSVVQEVVTAARPPVLFASSLSGFSGLLGRLVLAADTTWGFVDVQGRTQVSWRFRLASRSRAASVVLAIVVPIWLRTQMNASLRIMKRDAAQEVRNTAADSAGLVQD